MNNLLIMHKRILFDRCPVLYEGPITPERFKSDWDVRNAEWTCKEGALLGRNPKPAAGVVMSKREFPGNVLMDFYGQTVLPSTHDIDVMWNLGWDELKNDRGPAYVVGVQGWWSGKVGIEKSPEYKLVAAAPCPWFKPGQEYHVQAGSIDGHCFVFVDGRLQIELVDPNPIDSARNNRVGFEAYQCMIKISRLTVRQIVWEKNTETYRPEFD